MTWLNIDLGEHDDEDPELYVLADLVNLALGGHAGTEETIARSVQRAREAGARIGGHPSYPDLVGFGRTPSSLSGRALQSEIAAQLRRIGDALGHVKPHGALYHATDTDPAVARALLDAIDEVCGPALVIGPPGLLAAVRARGWVGWTEGFADRGTRADGSLIPRGEPGAVLTDPVAVAQRARALLGRVNTIGIHGDTPGAAALAAAVRAVL